MKVSPADNKKVEKRETVQLARPNMLGIYRKVEFGSKGERGVSVGFWARSQR